MGPGLRLRRAAVDPRDLTGAGREAKTGGVNNLVRDAFEVLIVVGVGGMLVTAIGRLRRGEIAVVRCVACGRPTSRAYPRCKHCDAEQPEVR